VFALHQYRPTPLYFLDEIDAALDFRNVQIIANYIKRNTTDAQFIIITLRNHMFEIADLLIGIYKNSDISNSLTVNPDHYSDGKDDRGLDYVPTKDSKKRQRDKLAEDAMDAKIGLNKPAPIMNA